MTPALSILYRGPLSSCNYGCEYCPFAKRHENEEELATDRAALERFCDKVESLRGFKLSILFTPWGEALVRRWYRDAFERLSALPNVEKVVAQTNLSSPVEFLERCDRSKVALWATFHPTEVPRERFVRRVKWLHERGVRLSVGSVAVDGALEHIEALRRELPDGVYLWVNAAKRVHGPYTDEELAAFEAIDPLFRLNATQHPSRGQLCHAGHLAISVDGEGTIRRCHFIRDRLGNLFTDDLEQILKPRRCPAETCGCHIGYVHLERLGLYEVFDGGVLERVPRSQSVPGGAPPLPE